MPTMPYGKSSWYYLSFIALHLLRQKQNSIQKISGSGQTLFHLELLSKLIDTYIFWRSSLHKIIIMRGHLYRGKMFFTKPYTWFMRFNGEPETTTSGTIYNLHELIHCLFLFKNSKSQNCYSIARIHAFVFKSKTAPSVNNSFVFQAFLLLLIYITT